MVKLAATPFSPFSEALNFCILHSIFPGRDKVALVTPLENGKPNKNEISNFKPAPVLNFVSKIYKLAIKNQIVIGTEKYLSPLVSTYRKSYNIRHVITKLVEDCIEKHDQNFTAGTVLADLSKVFGCIPHGLLIKKLEAYGFTIDGLVLVF